jgi:PAS domain S-box-containing protein
MTPSIDTVEMLQAILSSIDEGIHVVNAEGETIYYNAAVARLDGLDPEEVIGKLILDVFPSLDRDTSTLIRALQTGKPIKDQRQSYTNVKGKRVETVNTTLPIRVNGRIVGAVEVAKDISKIKSLSEQVIELQTKMHRGASKAEKGGSRTHVLYRAEDFLTQDERMLDMKRSLPRIAQTDSPVLVYGETGTGKEIVIQAIHSASPRAQYPFIAQNCAALPSELLESVDRVIMGPERRTRVITQKEKEIVAYHEGGHALVGHLLEHADPVQKISIVSRGMAAGYTKSLPEEDRMFYSRPQLMDRIAMALGGRVAEEVTFGEVTTGASNDLEHVTQIARAMVTRYGMSDKLLPRTFGKREDMVFLGREISEQRDYSEKVAQEIDDEVQNIVLEAYSTAKRLIIEHYAKLTQIARYLMVNETVEHRLAQAQQVGVAGGAAKQHLDDIAGTVIGGKDAVADRKGDGAKVIGDDPVRKALCPLIRPTGELAHLADGRPKQLGAVGVLDAAHHRDQAV